MYKTASRNRQKARGRDVSRQPRVKNFVGQRQARLFYYPVIFHAAQHGLELSEVQKMPRWLLTEVKERGIVAWLEANVGQLRPDVVARLRRSLRRTASRPKQKTRE